MEAAQTDDVLYAGSWRSGPNDGLVLAAGRALTLSVREFGLLVALVQRAGRIVSRAELYALVWEQRAARRRSIDRRLRPQAAREARDRAAGVGVHPHPRGLRLPLLARGFTRLSQLDHIAITGCGRCRVSLPRDNESRSAREVPESSPPPSRPAPSPSASPPAAASDDSSDSTGVGAPPPARRTVNATLNGAGSTFAAPIYQQVGADLKDKGLTINYQGVGSGAGVSQFAAGTVDFAGSDPALADEDKAADQEGRADPDPVRARRDHGLLQPERRQVGPQARRRDAGQHLPRQDHDLGRRRRSRRRTRTSTCPSTKITVVHRSDSSGTTKGFTQFLANYSPDVEERPGRRQGHQVADRHRRQGQRRRRRRGQADRRRDRLRRAGLRAAERLHVRRRQEQGRQVRRADAGVDLGRGRGHRGPGRPRRLDDRRARREAYPIVSQTFAITYADPCKAGLDKDKATGLKTLLHLPARRRPGHDQEAVLRPDPRRPARPRTRPPSTPCSATAPPIGS